VPIVASRHDDEDDNFAQGFNEVLCRDGRAAMTGALKMGNFKITGLGNATTDNDAVNKSQLDAQNTSLTTAINTKAADNAVVKLSGDQTIADIKTFTSSPIIPTPTSSDNSTKAATTKFVKTTTQYMVKYPNYGAAYDLTKANGTVPANGWLFCKNGDNASSNLSINGFYWVFDGSYGNEETALIPVMAGDTYTSTAWSAMQTFKFIPNRG
jgi:hypothetical protein